MQCKLSFPVTLLYAFLDLHHLDRKEQLDRVTIEHGEEAWLDQADFFSQRLQYLLQICAYLLSLAFETDQFYAPERIRLCPMPPVSMQRPYIAQFQERVLVCLRLDLSLSRGQTEIDAWQQIEEVLLAQAYDQQESGSTDYANTD